jgi:16S rRNA (uracil1498-N3)-methyltransferase
MSAIAHRLYEPQTPLELGAAIVLEGPEAHHAVRVKRLRTGEPVEILSGRGDVARARVEFVDPLPRGNSRIGVVIDSVAYLEPVLPAITVCCPAPKGDALESMIDQLSQCGARAWRHLRTDRTEREPRTLDRAERASIESMKQCGRAHAMHIAPPVDLDQAIQGDGAIVWAADASGGPLPERLADALTLLVGPEGGWSQRERDAFEAAKIPLARFGPHVLRIETAAIVGVACMLHQSLFPGERPCIGS